MSISYKRLDELDEDKEKWGGKAIGLYQLKKHGFNIPDGIVISSDLFKMYRESRLNENDIESCVSDLLNNHFPNKRTDLIFRSSANVEGSSDYCFSGVFDSFIFDPSISIFRNLARVWNSALTSTVKSYQRKSDTYKEILMAVLIQPLVHGKYSAVVQSFDIINNTNTIIVEYSCNGVDTVVNGEENSYIAYINPETMEVDYYDADSPTLSYKIIEQITHDCKEIEQLFGIHAELEIQLFDESIEYIQIREVG